MKSSNLKNGFYVLIGVVALVVFGVISFQISKGEEEETDTITYVGKIYTEEVEDCEEEPKLYTEYEDRNVYTYCLETIKIHDGNESVELSTYLKKNKIDALLDMLTLSSELKDGGTKIYKDHGTTRYSNHGLTVSMCNTLDGNQDIYIGPNSMNDSFCS